MKIVDKKCMQLLTLRNKLELLLYYLMEDVTNAITDFKFYLRWNFITRTKNPNSKNYSWRGLRRRNTDEIIRIIKNENLQVLCKNCHTCEEITNFVKFREIILSEKLSINNIGQIDDMIYEEIKNNIIYREERLKGAQHRARIKYRIKKWIKKRIVIEFLYNVFVLVAET